MEFDNSVDIPADPNDGRLIVINSLTAEMVIADRGDVAEAIKEWFGSEHKKALRDLQKALERHEELQFIRAEPRPLPIVIAYMKRGLRGPRVAPGMMDPGGLVQWAESVPENAREEWAAIVAEPGLFLGEAVWRPGKEMWVVHRLVQGVMVSQDGDHRSEAFHRAWTFARPVLADWAQAPVEIVTAKTILARARIAYGYLPDGIGAPRVGQAPAPHKRPGEDSRWWERIPDRLAAAGEACAAYRRATETADRARETRDVVIRHAIADGYRIGLIKDATGLTTERVYQIRDRRR